MHAIDLRCVSTPCMCVSKRGGDEVWWRTHLVSLPSCCLECDLSSHPGQLRRRARLSTLWHVKHSLVTGTDICIFTLSSRFLRALSG
eukprot:2725666-Pleurochrysis_carterae.AAC.1